MSGTSKASLNTRTALQLFTLSIIAVTHTFISRDLYLPLAIIVGTLALVYSLRKIRHSYLKLVAPLCCVFLLGLDGIFNHEMRNFMRDIAYSIFPLALIFVGFWLGGNKNIWPYFFKTLTICAIFLTLFHLSSFILNPELLSSDIYTIRKKAGTIGTLSTLVMILALIQKKLPIESLFPRFFPRFIFLPLILISFVLSFSRTSFILAIIFLLATLGFLNRIKRRSIMAISLISISIMVFVFTTPEYEVDSFRGKLVRSIDEITIADYSDMQEINENWRGFESYRAMDSFKSGSVSEKIFGQGFGATVDLGFYMELAGESIRFIPILHNGYIYILIKAGFIGLFCYIIFYIRLLKYAVKSCNSSNEEQLFLARLLLGCILSLILSMFVIGGMAEASESILIVLLGYLVQRLEFFRAYRVKRNSLV